MKASTVNISTYRFTSNNYNNDYRGNKSISASGSGSGGIPSLRSYQPINSDKTLLMRTNKFSENGSIIMTSEAKKNDKEKEFKNSEETNLISNPSNFEKFIILTKSSVKDNPLSNLKKSEISENDKKLKEVSSNSLNVNMFTKINKEMALPMLPSINKNNLSNNGYADPKEKSSLPMVRTFKADNKPSPINYNKSPSPDRRMLLKYFDATIEDKKAKLDPVQFNNIHSKNLEHLKKLNDRLEAVKRSSSTDTGSLKPLDRLKRIQKFFDKKEEKEKEDYKNYYYYSILPGNNGEAVKKCMHFRENWKESLISCQNIAHLRWQQSNNGIDFTVMNKMSSIKQMVNHFEYHSQISNKLNLFLNLMKYCENNGLDVFNYLPMTILIQYDSLNYLKQIQNFKEMFNDVKNFVDSEELDSEGKKKLKINRKYSDYFSSLYSPEKLGARTNVKIPDSHYNGKNLWLIKAVDMNCGRGIKLADNIERVEKLIKKFYNGIASSFKESEKEDIDPDAAKKSGSPTRRYRNSMVIIQKYIERPLLYKGRKFDIRLWALLTHKMDLYVFKEGHLKASSTPFDLNNINSYIHLTNYSVQKYNEDFSKYEIGNEVSFKDFQNFLNTEYPKDEKNVETIYKEICEIVKLTISCVKDKINVFDRKYSFEIFGYDFILDENFKPFLLECNTNPGLEESSPLIKQLVPRMLDDALRLTIDDVFPPKYTFSTEDGYQSPYPVDDTSNKENLWVYLCHYRDKTDLSKNLLTRRKR